MLIVPEIHAEENKIHAKGRVVLSFKFDMLKYKKVFFFNGLNDP
jgi:hypothetical protein